MSRGLHEALLDAHALADRARLVDLYAEAADRQNDTDAACFFLTHAYVYALETGHPAAGALHGRLKAEGREA